jgi:ABC-2 type transport system ATP-binding protein
MPAVIETEKLTKSYGPFRGIVDVDLVVNAGEVFGFLGPNGAGKTTTIRILLDLIRPTSGRAAVFGIESTADPVAIHRRIGYLPGEWNLYDRLTGFETITYFANLRGGMDRPYVDQLVQRLDLDPSRRFREYSRGNKQKVGLICALQHRPELLVLDEPTAGLDPLVQQTFNELLFEARGEGRTVFLSSHIISEVERTCDRVGIIRDGRIVRLDTVEAVRALAAHEVELRFAAPVASAPFAAVPGVKNLVEEGRALRMLVTGPIAPVVRLAGQYDLVDFVSREPSLEEVFLSEYGSGPGGAGNTDRGGASSGPSTGASSGAAR